jgi:D-alanyl-D-alanine-carboxypeptidase/D-alanyl-D-alanine-endopeptidase
MRSSRIVAGIACLASACHAPAPPASASDEIRRLLQARLANDGAGVGIVVGTIDANGREIVACGKASAGEPRQLEVDALFEIGSLNKVFTATVLAGMVGNGELALDDPVAKHLPANVAAPRFESREITLLDLATHTSGLPNMPDNLRPRDPDNPFADYTVGQLHAFVAGVALAHPIGSHYEYSNVGMALLGDALARRAGTDFATLVVDRLCRPLGMHDTRFVPTAAQQARLAPGHGRDLRKAPNWDAGQMGGAGGMRSSVPDLLTFLAANLGLIATPLAEAMQRTHHARRPTDHADDWIGLGWRIRRRDGSEILWHSGSTAGYRAFLGMDLRRRVGVVVLANARVPHDDLGFHLLDRRSPLHALPAAHANDE